VLLDCAHDVAPSCLQFRVVFMRPTLTSRHTMAMLMAAGRSVSSLSLRILLHLLLFAMASR
jgi:hypothetical protein